MKLKYRKCYLMLYTAEKDIDYWLALTWVGYGVYESCIEIPPRLHKQTVEFRIHPYCSGSTLDMTNFLLLSMNKKRDALDCYKKYGQDKMAGLDYDNVI